MLEAQVAALEVNGAGYHEYKAMMSDSALGASAFNQDGFGMGYGSYGGYDGAGDGGGGGSGGGGMAGGGFGGGDGGSRAEAAERAAEQASIREKEALQVQYPLSAVLLVPILI